MPDTMEIDVIRNQEIMRFVRLLVDVCREAEDGKMTFDMTKKNGKKLYLNVELIED